MTPLNVLALNKNQQNRAAVVRAWHSRQLRTLSCAWQTEANLSDQTASSSNSKPCTLRLQL